jgi:hypothetical protein
MARGLETRCDCGSGEYKEATHDGHGIFLFYGCDKCRERKLARYRPDIMSQYECDEPIEPEC